MRLMMLALWTVLACLTGGVLSAAEPLRVMSYNIHHGEGTDGKLDLERLAKIIVDSQADVVALQEVDMQAKRSGNVDQAKQLAELTKLHFVYGEAMPFQGGKYGGAVLSRWPIKLKAVHQLPQEPGEEPRIAIETIITPDNGLPEFVFVSTHLCHRNEAIRTRQATKLNELLPENDGAPILVAGDFNAQHGSKTLQTLREKRWLDTANKEKVIDYIFVRPSDPWRVVKTQTLDEPVASDHLPIVAVLEWKPAAP